jgi:predicted DsbA family dithiol-disulfide isomerase
MYGDFNCPFSALASTRLARLERAGIAEVDWRAVAHDLDIPTLGEPIGPRDRRAYEAEIEQVRGLLLTNETIELHVPTVRANTVAATESYAATTAPSRMQVRGELFRAYWQEGLNLGDPAALSAMGLAASAPGMARAWREQWLALDRPLVPIMVLPDGYVSRGLGALARLGELIIEGQSGHRQAELQT